MPGLPGYDPLDPTANLVRRSGVSVALVDAQGRTSRTRISGLGSQDLAVGENSRFAQAVGEASNMGAYGWNEDKENFRLQTDATAFDETYASAENVLYMVFQNNEARTITMEVPAPKATVFAADGVTLRDLPADSANDDADEEIIRELIDATENVINTSFLPVNSYAFQRGYRSSRKTKLPRPTGGKPIVAEPGANTGTA